MSSIAISEINTEATGINENDLFLVSKFNETNNTYTSAKIKFGNIPFIFPSHLEIGWRKVTTFTNNNSELQQITNDEGTTFAVSPFYTVEKTGWVHIHGQALSTTETIFTPCCSVYYKNNYSVALYRYDGEIPKSECINVFLRKGTKLGLEICEVGRINQIREWYFQIVELEYYKP